MQLRNYRRTQKKDQLRDEIFERQSTGKTKGSRTIQSKNNFNPKTEVKCQVQSCVDKIIVIIKARKQDVFDAVGNQAKKSLESLSQKKRRSRKTETVLKRLV